MLRHTHTHTCGHTQTCPHMECIESFFTLQFVLWQLLRTWLWPELTEHLRPPAHRRTHPHTKRVRQRKSVTVSWPWAPWDSQTPLWKTDTDHTQKKKKNSEQCRLSFLSLSRPTLRKRATHKTTREVMDYFLGDTLQNPLPYMHAHNVATSKIRAE